MTRYRLADEDGAVAVLVTVVLVALLGVSMLTIDGGALWASRRNVIVDTDAAALAAARQLLEDGCGVTQVAAAETLGNEVLADNDSTTVGSTDVQTCVGQTGRVSASATRSTALAFGGLFGIEAVDVAASSIVQVGPVASAKGVRPIGICSRDPHFLELLLAKNLITAASLTPEEAAALAAVMADPNEHPGDAHRIQFSRTSIAGGCGESNGNWGWLDFNGSGGGFKTIRDWLETGYPGSITVGTGEDCAPELDITTCPGKQGAGGNSPDDVLTTIACLPVTVPTGECIATGKAFPIIVYSGIACDLEDSSTTTSRAAPAEKPEKPEPPTKPEPPEKPGGKDCQTNGANVRYDADTFLGVIIRGWSNITGNGDQPSYFDLEFVDSFITDGTISATPPGTGPGLVGIQQCGGGYGTTVDDYCVITP